MADSLATALLPHASISTELYAPSPEEYAPYTRPLMPWFRLREPIHPEPEHKVAPSRVNPYDPFFIPRSMLFETPTSTQSDSLLLQLPDELLSQIFQHVRVAYFQVCLALTCKTMGRIASVPGAMALWRGYRDKDGLFRLLERKAWIPRSLRLCRACFLFRPRSTTYWANKISRAKEYDRPDANWYDIFSFLDDRSSSQHRCPSCVINVYTTYISETYYENHRKMVIEFPEDAKTVHPSLYQRIEKP